MTLPPLSDQIDLSRELPFRLGAMDVIPGAREVVLEGRREALEPRIMQVLVALARKRDTVVTRDELIMSCWYGRVVGEDAITRCIGRIRRLSETGGGFTLETIPRLGFRMTEMPPPVSGQELAPETFSLRAFVSGHRLLVIGGAVGACMALVAMGLAVWLMLTPRGVSPDTPKFTIAVLPFTPPPGDRQAEQLGEAISAVISDTLVREGLDVISPAKTRLFRGASKADAAQALKADFVIDGEIRREGGLIKARMRTIEASNGTTLVADTVEAPADQSDSIPELASAAIMGCGWGWITGLNPNGPWNLRVIAGSVKVVKHLSHPNETIYAYRTAKQIAAMAPDDAYAQYLLAISAATDVPLASPDRRESLLREARDAAAKSLHLEPEFGEVYLALTRSTPPFHWTRREALLRQGLRLRVSSPLTYMELLALRSSAGYFRIAGRMAEGSFASHPPFDNTTYETSNARLWLGDPEGARQLIARGLKLYPDRTMFPGKMFEATAFYGAPDQAEAFLKTPMAGLLLEPQGEGKTYARIAAALRHHRPADIKTVVNDCLNISGRSLEFRRLCFQALVKLGRLDDAYRMAEQLYPDQRGAGEAEIKRRWLAQPGFNTVYLVIPLTAPLRADPRYRDLVERVGLLQFWKERGTAPDFCAAENVPLCRELKA